MFKIARLLYWHLCAYLVLWNNPKWYTYTYEGSRRNISEPTKNNKKDVEAIQIEKRKELIEQLIRYRKSKKITQADISESTGIQRPNISRLESGKYNPTLDMIVRVADSIGLEVEINLKEKEN